MAVPGGRTASGFLHCNDDRRAPSHLTVSTRSDVRASPDGERRRPAEGAGTRVVGSLLVDRSTPRRSTDPTAHADPGELRDIAVTVATEAASLAVRVRERVVDPEGGLDTKSSATDVVTEGDTACEELVRRRLGELRPGDAVLGEEGGTEEGRTRVRWVVDPIDGTVN